jgi:DNA-binding response OmpR family regulator
VREIRDQPGGEGRAVVVVSAKHGIEVQAKDAGSDDFVAKPFDPDGLSTRTRAAVRWRAADDAEDVDDGSAEPA